MPYRANCVARECTISAIDLDVTKRCNLQCTYCFKGDLAGDVKPHMPIETAFAAVDWLIDNSGPVDYLNVNFMGGEPLMAFRGLVERLVPYAKRRCIARGKTVQFGTTTNLTLVTEEIVSFSARWGMGWHLSIDGLPVVQLEQRLSGNRELLRRVESAVRMILAYRPGFCARATFAPESFHLLHDSYRYLKVLGFRRFGFAKSTQSFDESQHRVFLNQTAAIADDVFRDLERGIVNDHGTVTWLVRSCLPLRRKRRIGCGAGRGYVMVDELGDIWPCHRFDGAARSVGQEDLWRMGSIYEELNHERHRRLMSREEWLDHSRCRDCPLRSVCLGGCPAENLSETGSVDVPRENVCRLYVELRAMMSEKVSALRRIRSTHVRKFLSELKVRESPRLRFPGNGGPDATKGAHG